MDNPQVGTLRLDELSWTQVRSEIDAGRNTVVVCFGATEQHGPHLPLGTDAMLGDKIGYAVAGRLDAFVAPTVRVGCSEHHMHFAGSISLRDETFHAVVADITRSLARHGFRRIVLVPTHGGNFAPLGQAVERMGEIEGVRVIGLSDVNLLLEGVLAVGAELGIPVSEGGIHAGEWETSMMLECRPELVHMDRAEVGYTGDLGSGIQKFLTEGVDSVSDNGVFGDPRRASAEAGKRYFDHLVDAVVRAIVGDRA